MHRPGRTPTAQPRPLWRVLARLQASGWFPHPAHARSRRGEPPEQGGGPDALPPPPPEGTLTHFDSRAARGVKDKWLAVKDLTPL